MRMAVKPGSRRVLLLENEVLAMVVSLLLFEREPVAVILANFFKVYVACPRRQQI